MPTTGGLRSTDRAMVQDVAPTALEARAFRTPFAQAQGGMSRWHMAV